MKRIISLLLICCFAALTVSCSASGKNEGISIITSCFPLYDFASELLGDDGEVTLLLKPGQDNHSYEPSAKDIVRIKSCDLFLYIGGEDESWVSSLLSGKDLENVKRLSLIETVPPIAIEDGHTVDDGHDHSHSYDEHIWTSPKNAVKMVKTISDELISLFPELKDKIEERTDSCIAKLENLDSSLSDVVSNAERSTVIFGDRFPFIHLFTDYCIEYEAAFPGCSDMTEPSAATIAALISKIKNESIPVVFRTQFSNGRIAETISAQTGAQVLVLHSLANVTRDEWDSGETYCSLMTKNIEALRTALGQK